MTELERQLREHLSPVKAPVSLRLRMQEKPVRQPVRWVIWPAVAAVALMLWQVRGAPDKPPVVRAAGGCVACHVRGL